MKAKLIHFAFMKLNPNEISDELLTLPINDRAQIARRLILSLDDSTEADENLALSEVWAQEIDRRVAELESGKVKTIPLEQTMSRLREKLQNARRTAS